MGETHLPQTLDFDRIARSLEHTDEVTLASRMASWSEFEAAEPEFAARVRKLMTSRKHLTMATLRRDGSPRISGTEVEFAGGELRIGSMPRAVKAIDLRRDQRVAIHGPTTDPPAKKPAGWKGETKIAGTAREVESGSDAHRFLIDIREAVITRLNDAGNRLVVESWNPDRGYRAMERD
jgi:hypothetical protein